ncbi:two-component system response regulator YesN [Paenibacillus phyllosphaerae]|uniref:Two-component system response regulator YesN n=1 Tax=Paenibacillus phyllosphaerae TaxID=274593 RepID=A0A7W5FNJ8_9BACL|nr:response regulator [Paenibacillus phyllosphaerae]MBB3111207.1 two-component system response regulator YesN [Paenibacillus phyllosphaerae]
MSYRVLLADDERLDLEGMRTFIPWEELGLHVVDAVSNGFNARSVLESEQIDILVTDVRMPHMSGLELAEQAMEGRKDLKVIFVSGYQDFHYAKKAMSLNACGYVLKPMDDQELIDSLVKARNQLDQVRKQEAAYSSMVPVVKNEYLLQLFEGTYTNAAIDVLERDYQLSLFDWPGRAVVLEIDDFAVHTSLMQEQEGKGLTQTLMEQLMNVVQDSKTVFMCKVDQARIALLVDATVRVEQLLLKLRERMPCTITAGAGTMCGSVPELSRSYRQALEALDNKMFKGKGKIIDYHEISTSEMEDIRTFDLRMDALFQALSSYELVRIHDELGALFLAAKNVKSKFTVRNYALYILMKLHDHLRTLNEDLFQLLGMDLKSLDVIMQFETIDDIHLWLRQRMFTISELLHSKGQKKNWKLIREIIQYVEERIASNITLRDIAEQFSFSPNYLGLLFKEETGQNFSEYLIMLRMERACALLKETNLKIYEIADRVGYRYLPYFSRQFKETYGKTPLEFRRS